MSGKINFARRNERGLGDLVEFLCNLKERGFTRTRLFVGDKCLSFVDAIAQIYTDIEHKGTVLMC